MIGQLLKAAQRARLVYWKVKKPITIGVRAIITDNVDQILLVRHSYTSGWYLPGGGVKRNESLIDALTRELRQETGIQLTAPPTTLGAYSSFQEHKSDHIVLFLVASWTSSRTHSIEISTLQFFNPDQLPSDTSPATRRRIEEFRGRTAPDALW